MAENGRICYFEYLLTRFTEPNELFGAVNVAAFREGRGAVRDTRGMLPQAELVFLDEVFKANSAILNALLTVLNERIFYNGSRRELVPLLCAIGATNAVPDDVELAALYDRFLLRAWTDNVDEALFPELFRCGWEMERRRIARGPALGLANLTTTEALRTLHKALERIDLTTVARDYREVVRRIRTEGIYLSDRRVVKLLKLIAASALRHHRDEAHPGDFWVLRHVWNDPEQIPHLQAIVNHYVQPYQGESWTTERTLAHLEAELDALEVRRAHLKTDTDYADFLQQLETHRRELLRHSAGTERAPPETRILRDALLERITTLLDDLMKLLEETL